MFLFVHNVIKNNNKIKRMCVCVWKSLFARLIWNLYYTVYNKYKK